MSVTQKELDSIFEEIGSQLEKESDITICGGSSIVLVHKSRESTEDIDLIQCDSQLLQLANRLCFKKFRTGNWFNEDVKVTQSYTPQLVKWRTPYKRFGKLMVYLISGVALLCMKLKSFRSESNDYRDCKSLISYARINGYTYDNIMHTFTDIYSQNASMSVEAENFLKDEFKVSEFKLDTESLRSFIDMIDRGLITIDEVPQEFRNDVLMQMFSERPYAKLVQECLNELNSNKTYFDVRNILPKTELPKEVLLGVLSKVAK